MKLPIGQGAVYPVSGAADAYASTTGKDTSQLRTVTGILQDGSNGTGEYSSFFIPTIWSGKLIEKFYDSTVLAAISNTDYEGEIRNQGDTVVIRTRPSVTIKKYKADQKLEVERPISSVLEFQIDKGIYWNTILDDVMETQSDLNLMDLWATDASEQAKIVIDKEVLRGILPDVDAKNKGANAGRISGNINLGVTGTPRLVGASLPGSGLVSTILDLIVEMGQCLDEYNAPTSGRYIVLPAWCCSLIKKSDLADASFSGDSTTMLRNGQLGMINEFTIYKSNLLPSGTADGLAAGETIIFAGIKSGLTFASQLTKLETLRSESTFGTLMRGLQVYGFKVIDGKMITAAVVKAGKDTHIPGP